MFLSMHSAARKPIITHNMQYLSVLAPALQRTKCTNCCKTAAHRVLQGVFAKKMESCKNQLFKADAEKRQLEQQVKTLEEQLARATQQVVERVQQAADKDEDAGRQLSLLRKVRLGYPPVDGQRQSARLGGACLRSPCMPSATKTKR